MEASTAYRPLRGCQLAGVAAVVCVRPADILLQFERQFADCAFGPVTGASGAVLMSHAAETRHDGHLNSPSSLALDVPVPGSAASPDQDLLRVAEAALTNEFDGALAATS